MSLRDEKVCEVLKNLAAQFLACEGDRSALITVTAASISSNHKNATILLTVFPTEKEEIALDFARRKLSNFRSYVQSNTRFKYTPYFNFEIDKGEKNRQRIDALSNS